MPIVIRDILPHNDNLRFSAVLHRIKGINTNVNNIERLNAHPSEMPSPFRMYTMTSMSLLLESSMIQAG